MCLVVVVLVLLLRVQTRAVGEQGGRHGYTRINKETEPIMTVPGWWTEKFVLLTGIPSEETFWDISTVPDPVDVSLESIGSSEAFGNLIVANTQIIGLMGASSSEQFGNLTVVPPPQEIYLNGIPSEEAFGGSDTSPGATNISLTGIPSAQAFGSMTVIGPDQDITAGGKSSDEAFGTPEVKRVYTPTSPVAFTSSGTYNLPADALAIDYAALGGGAGGDGTPNGVVNGPSGNAGQWAIGTLIVGTDIKIGSSILIVIGAGGAGGGWGGGLGSPGVVTTLTYQDPGGTNHTINAARGTRAGNPDVSPATQTLNGQTYTGGTGGGGNGQAGVAPAGGGGGGHVGGATNGGHGAAGKAWLYAHN
jgi:hypothetical protein